MNEPEDIRDLPYIVIEERWTRYSGERKINGQWEPIDLSLYGGRPPFYIVEWFNQPESQTRESWVECDCDPEYAHHCPKCGGTGKISLKVPTTFGSLKPQ